MTLKGGPTYGITVVNTNIAKWYMMIDNYKKC